MQTYYLAIDIGASGGRHILGSKQNGTLCLEEVYRFENGMEKIDGKLCWNTKQLFSYILEGMKKCKELGKIPVSVGIDTWGVDFVLLNKEGKMLGQAVGYRDHRTEQMDHAVEQMLPWEEHYERTGIAKQMYNTIYQLMAVKQENPEYLEEADVMLLTPDYYHYLLTGIKKQEYTIASTSALVNLRTKQWDNDLIDSLGFPRGIFLELEKPGTVVGNLTDDVQEIVGYNSRVVQPASHDTASAVMALPTKAEDTLYISSGTWSLMGIEIRTPNCLKESREANFTNEGGYGYRYRYLKNIMGLWMIQSVKKEVGDGYSYEEICEMASTVKINSLVDCNDSCFLSPESMVEEVRSFCRKTDQQVPETLAELAAVIYHSLAKCYADTKKQIEELTGKSYDCINIIGGGSQADYLNRLTAKYSGCKVLAGPTEATSIGNILSGMLQNGEFTDLSEARACVGASFGIKEYSF
ncbi:MAG: rhamnulokinase [Herbinix sp.]|jgi:rhamnulokinase|nr:rhamnulokinase [Herbinix sp.]